MKKGESISPPASRHFPLPRIVARSFCSLAFVTILLSLGPLHHSPVRYVFTVTPVDLLHSFPFRLLVKSICLGFTPHLLNAGSFHQPLRLRGGQWIALGTPFSGSERWFVATQHGEVCATIPIPRAPFPRSRPHSQRTVWKAQRGCFSKLSPNLRTRSRLSTCESLPPPFIIILQLR